MIQILILNKRAAAWGGSMPLSKGRLETMFYVGIESNMIQINEDTFGTEKPLSKYKPICEKEPKYYSDYVRKVNYVEAKSLYS